jgi:hypothetical protein
MEEVRTAQARAVYYRDLEPMKGGDNGDETPLRCCLPRLHGVLQWRRSIFKHQLATRRNYEVTTSILPASRCGHYSTSPYFGAEIPVFTDLELFVYLFEPRIYCLSSQTPYLPSRLPL